MEEYTLYSLLRYIAELESIMEDDPMHASLCKIES